MSTQRVSLAARRSLLALAAALATTALVTVHGAEAAASVDPVIDAQMLVYEINEARWNPPAFQAAAGDVVMPAVAPAPPLAIVASLGSAAMFKANELADHGYFAHQSAVTGVWPNRLARAHGYPLPSSWSDTANNIESLHGGSPDPFRVLVSFANSPSHRRHIFGEGAFFGEHRQIGVGRSGNQNLWAVHTGYVTTNDTFVTGVVYHDANGNGRMDRGEGLGGVTVRAGTATTTTNAGGGYAIEVGPGARTVTASGGSFSGSSTAQVTVGSHNVGVDFVSGRSIPIVKATGASGWPSAASSASLCANGSRCDTVSLVDDGGRWHRYRAASATASVESFYYGNPGDIPFSGDWNGDGAATPGLYRQSDGFAYLRNSNTQGIADMTFYFGNPLDVPLVGDFNGNGRDTVSLYRPSETRVYVMNRLGYNGIGIGAAQYSFIAGDFGDRPFAGDFNGNGIDTVGLYRPSNGWVYLRNTNSPGAADLAFPIGTGWDIIFAGDWNGDGKDTVAAYRRSTGTVYFAAENSATTTGFSLQVGWFRSAVASAQS